MKRLGTLFLGWISVAVLAAQDTPKEWNDRGLEAAQRGAHAESEVLYQKAIAGWKAKGAEFDVNQAVSLLNLGQSYCAQGKRRDASSLFEEALVKFRRVLGARNEWTLTSMNLLGAVYLMLGESARAAALFEEALPIEREILPG